MDPGGGVDLCGLEDWIPDLGAIGEELDLSRWVIEAWQRLLNRTERLWDRSDHHLASGSHQGSNKPHRSTQTQR